MRTLGMNQRENKFLDSYSVGSTEGVPIVIVKRTKKIICMIGLKSALKSEWCRNSEEIQVLLEIHRNSEAGNTVQWYSYVQLTEKRWTIAG